MNYYNMTNAERDETGIDYDLYACLYENPQGFTVEDIKRVLAVIEGENDGPSWYWVLQLKDGRFVYLTGACDYTGWDCQSWASHEVLSAENTLLNVDPENAQELMEQIRRGKKETWRERTDKEFGL